MAPSEPVAAEELIFEEDIDERDDYRSPAPPRPVQRGPSVRKVPQPQESSSMVPIVLTAGCATMVLGSIAFIGLGVWFLTTLPMKGGRNPAMPAPRFQAQPGRLGQPNVAIPGETYQNRRASFQTVLTKHGPAPQPWEPQILPENVAEVRYPSGDLSLKAWVYTPPGDAEKRPALVFFHGGFAFDMSDLLACRPFMDAGYVVMAPALRGENGNPGEFEMFAGEVDDAGAAIKWLAGQPGIDSERIVAFGHSVGGGISALLSLSDDIPLRHSGSSGGLYPADTFAGWADIVPFSTADSNEVSMRLLLGNQKHMQRRHFAYVGRSDGLAPYASRANLEVPGGSMLEASLIAGDHFSSFDAALNAYLAECQKPLPAGGAGLSKTSRPTVTTPVLAPQQTRTPSTTIEQRMTERAETASRKAETEDSPARAAYAWKVAAEAWHRAGNRERTLDAISKSEAAGPEARSELLAHYWHRKLGELLLELDEPERALPHLEAAIGKTTIEGYIKDCRKAIEKAKARIADGAK